ncbi:sigma-70 family RNA polymerase sigma factor [candidate division KSB1 bacterium]|nr:sigma-70 family RNA polymerase sigma factor [candidate division KSB1 bacterium]
MPLLQKKYDLFSDERLMELLQQGDAAGQEAFDELYERYGQRMLFYFHRMLGGDHEKAQDFLQELFLKIVERSCLFNVEQRFRTWIYTVAHNMCKNEYRHIKISKIIEPATDLEAIAPAIVDEEEKMENALDWKRFRAALFQELAKLDESHRATFLLRHQDGFSIKEISEVLGCSEGTTKSRLFYTARKLAVQLSAFHPKADKPQFQKLTANIR